MTTGGLALSEIYQKESDICKVFTAFDSIALSFSFRYYSVFQIKGLFIAIYVLLFFFS